MNTNTHESSADTILIGGCVKMVVEVVVRIGCPDTSANTAAKAFVG